MAFLPGFEFTSDYTISGGNHIISPFFYPAVLYDASVFNTILYDQTFTSGSTVKLPLALFRDGFEIITSIDATGSHYIKPYPDSLKVFYPGNPLFPGSALVPEPGDTGFEVKYGEVVYLESNFIADTVIGAHPLTVNFTDLSLGVPIDWHWNFGDGTHSYLQNPTHTYINRGVYTVSLAVNSLDGQYSIRTANNYIVVTGQKTVRFWNETIGEAVDHVLWNFGDGTTSSSMASPIDHVYAMAGTYDATLEAWSIGGSYGSTVKIVTVTGANAPEADFLFSIDATNYRGVHFTDISTHTPIGWDWSWGDGSANGTTQNPTHIFASYDTTYNVTLTAINAGGSDSTTKQVVTLQNPLPVANFSRTVDTTNPKAFQFNDLSLKSPTTWDWSWGDGLPNSSSQNPFHIFPNYDTTYTVSLTASNVYGSDTSRAFVYSGTGPINVPYANFSWTVDSFDYKEINFLDLSLNTPTSWDWTWGDGSAVGTTQNPSHIYDNYDTTYAVTLNVSNLAGTDGTTINVVTGRNIAPMPDELFYFVNENPNLIAWYPFTEASHTTGYTPNVANQTDGSSLRLLLNSFGAGEYVGDGLLNIIDNQSGYLSSAVVPSLQISTDLTIILEHKIGDTAVGTRPLLLEYAPGESLATNIMYEIDRDVNGNITLKHEYGSGSDTVVASGVQIPRDSSSHFIAIRRDVTLNRYESKIDSSAFVNVTYTNNPAGGSSGQLYIPISSAPQANGEYRNVMIFNRKLTDSEVEIIRTNIGDPIASWFNYTDWTSSTGTGRVTYNHSAPIPYVSWYKGENNTVDTVSRIDGSWSGTPQYTTGYIGRCFDLNGSSFISITDTTRLSPNHIEVECYIYRRTVIGLNDTVIKKPNMYSLEFNNNAIKFYVYNGSWVATPERTLSLNTWYKVKAFFDGDRIALYINDALVGFTNVTTPLVQYSQNLIIGSDSETPTKFFNGLIDEVRIGSHNAATLSAITNTSNNSTQVHQWRSSGPDAWEAQWSTLGKSLIYPCDSHVITYPTLKVPKGSTIISAIPHYTPPNNQPKIADSTCNARLYFTNSASPTHPSGAAQAQALSLTSYATWSDIPGWVANTDYTGPSLHAILQTITDRSDWTYGNPLQQVAHNGVSIGEGARAGSTYALYNLEVVYNPPAIATVTTKSVGTLCNQWRQDTTNNYEPDFASLGNNSGIAFAHVITYPALNIPKGATILSAIPHWVSADNYVANTCNVNMYFTQADNPTHPNTATGASSLPLTAPTSWNNISAWASGVDYTGPDMKAALQTIVNRPGWVAGNTVQFVCRDANSSSAGYRSSNTPNLCNLVVTYSMYNDVAPHNMTSNTAPSPYVASASTVYSIGGTWPAYLAFNGTLGVFGYWLATTNTGWLKLDFGLGNVKKIYGYGVQVNTIPEPNRAPRNWTLEGSNDDTTWSILDTVTGETSWSDGELRYYSCDVANASYRYFRLNVTLNNGDALLQVGELYLYGK